MLGAREKDKFIAHGKDLEKEEKSKGGRLMAAPLATVSQRSVASCRGTRPGGVKPPPSERMVPGGLA